MESILNNPDNLVVCDFNTIANIEPALIGVYLFQVRSDLQLVTQGGKILFYDNTREEKVAPIYK